MASVAIRTHGMAFSMPVPMFNAVGFDGVQSGPTQVMAMVIMPSAALTAPEPMPWMQLNPAPWTQPTSQGPTEKQNTPMATMAGRVWALSQKQKGCRSVQDALDACKYDQERKAIAAELEGHVWDAVRCPHANYVIQKLIMTLSPYDSQFIIDEIMTHGPKAPGQVSRHRYGCRIMQRLLEHCRPEQLEQLVENLIRETLLLSKHQFGNFVIQQLLEHGTDLQRGRACHQLARKACELGSDPNASAVLAKAMACASLDDQTSLAHTLLSQPGLLTAMAHSRHGHLVAQCMLQVLEGPELEHAVAEVASHASALTASRYGRLVVKSLPEMAAEGTLE
eukprot:TRINITY_DN92064_c0_g1_i1.p1 TRINITY_DN92064_c0_g1~~TRINITY_DN92064_c0_g1_i1.p1  ORF type:complete len:363 (+),score=61.53 TRINITY_DN92064_c0_g1_i1:83-1090(+)